MCSAETADKVVLMVEDAGLRIAASTDCKLEEEEPRTMLKVGW